ncbi:hypothetical protein MVEN_02338500 [Mycena venus]|uniref:Uncharacterized protein n=1 Tax=Mycena venus TaxID=2733690 RepID=A0A8H6X432_9AGAR|nr:hypothetical protein MVEN_02338500 [Mycena venus]
MAQNLLCLHGSSESTVSDRPWRRHGVPYILSDDEGTAQEAKPAAKAPKAPSAATASNSKKSKTVATKPKPNIIAEAVSDESAADQESDGSDEDSEGDEESDDKEGGSVAPAELNRERPQILSNRRPISASMSKRTESDHEMHSSNPDSLFDDNVIVCSLFPSSF